MKRSFKEGYPNHVYCKGVRGNLIFYSTADCLFYVTLYSCLARKHKIRTNAFSIMPNHTHAQQEAERKEHFIHFNQDLLSQYSRGYNKQHKQSGDLFEKPFGSVPKIGEKYIRNNLSYINNNGASGKLSKGVVDYRWNLMAYYCSDHPFSEKIVLNRAKRRMKWAIKYVEKLRMDNKALDYRRILDYYGSFENAIRAMDANTGSEHDLKEDWEDYSEY